MNPVINKSPLAVSVTNSLKKVEHEVQKKIQLLFSFTKKIRKEKKIKSL